MHLNILTAAVAALAFAQGIAAAPAPAPAHEPSHQLQPALQPRSNEALNPPSTTTTTTTTTTLSPLDKRGVPGWLDAAYLLLREIIQGDKKHNYHSSSSHGYPQRYDGGEHYDDSYYNRQPSYPGYPRGHGSRSDLDFDDGTRGSSSSSSRHGDDLQFDDGYRRGGAQIEYPYQRGSA